MNYTHNLTNPDTEIEQFMISNKIKHVKLDLYRNQTGAFQNHRCHVYPPCIASKSEIYDTMYWCDYLLKHIFRILMSMIIHNCDEQRLKEETFLIGIREIPELGYKVSNIECNYGYLRIIDLVSSFISFNDLKGKREEIEASYLEYKASMTPDTVMSANVVYNDIKYSLEPVDGAPERQILKFRKLCEKVELSCRDGDNELPVPAWAKYLQQFFNQYYDDIREAFPIYNRFENIYRLCALNAILDNFTPNTEQHETVYIDTYVRSIMCSGGFEGDAENLIVTLPQPQKPVSNKIVEICSIKRGLADAPIKIGALNHAGIMVKTSQGEHHIIEWGPNGGVLRKTNPVIIGSTVIEETHKWTMDSCDKMRSNEYDPERLKTLMDIITHGQSYDLIANNCQDVKQKLLDALM
jgi:hypothetical protein